MGNILSWTIGIIIFLTVLTISVGLHEAGHMIAARLFKIQVPQFFVGFGPKIWSFTRKGTEYGIRAIPLGGFVQIEDDSQPEKSLERSMLSYVAPWKRVIIFMAGPIVNLILGVAILMVLLMSIPVGMTTTTIQSVNSCGEQKPCYAEQAGLKANDRILSVDGQKIDNFDKVSGVFRKEGSTVVVERNNQEKIVHVPGSDNGMIGIRVKMDERPRGFVESSQVIGDIFYMNLVAITKIPSKIPNVYYSIVGKEQRSQDSVSSVIGVGKVYADTTSSSESNTRSKFQILSTYTAMFNIGLGFANLLPFMPLDGGRIFVAFMDSLRLKWSRIRRKMYTPVPHRWVSMMTMVTGTLVVGFMILVMIADIVAPVNA